jgi:hypothetical protein
VSKEALSDLLSAGFLPNYEKVYGNHKSV